MGNTGPRLVRTAQGFTRATLVVIAGLTVLAVASHFLADWLWFSAIGYLNVFWIILRGSFHNYPWL